MAKMKTVLTTNGKDMYKNKRETVSPKNSPKLSELISGKGGNSGFICTALRTCPTAFKS